MHSTVRFRAPVSRAGGIIRPVQRLLAVAVLLTAGSVAAEPSVPAPSLREVLTRAGERVAQFVARAQSIMCLEVVRLQPLDPGLSPAGFARVVESELRLSWDAAAEGDGSTEAHAVRQLLKVNGHPPRKGDWESCTEPEQQTTEPQPLSMLLPANRVDYDFRIRRMQRMDGRHAVELEYKSRGRPTIDVEMVPGRDDCVSFDLDGGIRGRIWIDAETFDVLRLDRGLIGMIDVPLPEVVARRPGSDRFWVLERWDISIRFKPVTFTDPDETLILPVLSTSLRVSRGSAHPRLRKMTEYTNYRRFLTGARVIGN
jgi:hypothetical protein